MLDDTRGHCFFGNKSQLSALTRFAFCLPSFSSSIAVARTFSKFAVLSDSRGSPRRPLSWECASVEGRLSIKIDDRSSEGYYGEHLPHTELSHISKLGSFW